MSLTLEQAIARVPQWAGFDNIKATPLGGGITNNNFRIDIGEESYVLRIAGEGTEFLGINRNNEYIANQLAGNLGIAPEVFYFIQPEGYLVTRFIKGRPILPDEICTPENIRRVMDIIKKIHAMQAIPGIFNVFQIVRAYTNIARRYKVMFPNNYAGLIKRLDEAERALNTHTYKPCPCHNDLLNANFLTNGKLYILDWEYAGMGDPFFDLANFSGNHNFSEDQDQWMLKCYYGEEIMPNHWAHLMIMKVLSDIREATWGLVQIGISKLDFDFRGYADTFFGRVMDNIYNPNWKEYLKEVSKNV